MSKLSTTDGARIDALPDETIDTSDIPPGLCSVPPMSHGGGEIVQRVRQFCGIPFELGRQQLG